MKRPPHIILAKPIKGCRAVSKSGKFSYRYYQKCTNYKNTKAAIRLRRYIAKKLRGSGYTFQEIGNFFQVSRQRAFQIYMMDV